MTVFGQSKRRKWIIVMTVVIIRYTFFLIFDPKYRLWVLLEAVLTCTHNQSFEQKY